MSQILTSVSNVSKSIMTKKESRLVENKIEVLLNETDKEVLEVMKSLIHKHIDPSLWDLLEYSLLNKKHYERAFYVRLGCEAVGGNWRNILQTMASVEFRYASLVVVDDVFDKTDLRMGRDSLPKHTDNNITVTIGAILKSLSSIALAENYSILQLPTQRFVNMIIQDEISHYKVYLGQYADLKSESMNFEEMTDDLYMDMIKNTTGVDVGFCVMVGGVFGGGNEKQTENLYEFGLSLGTAMQMRDDLLDFIDSYEVINKSPFMDVEQKKKRLPLILAYRFASNEVKASIIKLMDKDNLNHEEREMLGKLVIDDKVLNYLNNYLEALKQNASNKFTEASNDFDCTQIVEDILKNIIVIN